MKDLEHNNFPVRKKMKRKDLNLSAKEMGKAIKKNQKIARGFLHEFRMENYKRKRASTLRECLCIHKVCKV